MLGHPSAAPNPMALFRIDDRYPDYSERFADIDSVIGASVYALENEEEERVGSINTVLIDDRDRIRYLVVDTGFWIFGKKVLLPVGRCVDDPERARIYAVGLRKAQVEKLPEYRDDLVVDDDYEAQVKSVYVTPAGDEAATGTSAPANQAALESNPEIALGTAPAQPNGAMYDQMPELYATNDEHHRRLRLYEERLVVDKQRIKTGEVTITKQVETDTVDRSLGVQKEKIVIEIESIAGATRVNVPEDSVQVGAATHMDLHGERAHVYKEPVVAQEINIRKVVEEEVVTVAEPLRRETLDVQPDGTPEVDIVDSQG